MVAVYELLPTAAQERAAEDTGLRSSFLYRVRSVSSALDVLHKAFHAHADALNDAWLSELERLGMPVFVCFMLLRVGLLSLAVFWGFLIVGPLWCISLVSSDHFLPSAIQAGLIVTLLIIVEPLLFVALMKDPRSKVFHILYSMYLLVGWREICVYLVRDEILGRFASRSWVRDLIFTFASAAVLACGALGWTMWEGWPRRMWTLYTISSLLFLQTIHLKFRTDS